MLASVLGLSFLTGGELTPVTLGLQPRAARTAPDGVTGSPVIAGNGRYVFFVSDARNLVTNAVESWGLNLYRHDRQSRTTELINVGMGAYPNATTWTYSVSADGQRVTWGNEPNTWNPPPEEGNVFVRDLSTGTTTLISRSGRSFEPVPADGPSWGPTLSDDGRHLIFSTLANDLPGLQFGLGGPALVLHDLDSGENSALAADRFGRSTVDHLVSADADVFVYRIPEPQYFPGGERWTYLRSWRRSASAFSQVGLSLPPSEVVGEPNRPSVIAMSANGKRLAFSLMEFRRRELRGLWVHELDSGVSQQVLLPPRFGDFTDMTWSDDGQRMALLEWRPDSGGETRMLIWTEGLGIRTLSELVEAPAIPPANPEATSQCLLSPDGRLLLFCTAEAVPAAGVLEAGHLNTYFRELSTGRTRLLARNANDIEASFSTDGHWLAYQSSERLDPSDDNDSSDVFVIELPDGTPERVSVGLASAPLATAGGGSWVDGGLSDDGRWIVFSSSAGDLAPNDTNGRRDVFAHDRLLRTNVMVSVGQDGRSAATGARWGRISANGGSVLFLSTSPDLTGSPTNEGPNLFVRDLSTGRTAVVSTDPDTGKALGQTPANVWIAGDGRQVVMDLHSNRTYQDDQWVGHPARLLLWDETSGTTEDLLKQLAAIAGGVRGPHPGSVRVSQNAEVIAFSHGTEEGDIVEVWDRTAGTLTRLPVRKDSGVADLSRDGRWVLTRHGPINGYDPIQDVWFTTPRSYTLYDRVRGVATPVDFPASMAPSVPQFTGDSQHLVFFSPVAGDGGSPVRRQALLYSLQQGIIKPVLDGPSADQDVAKAQLSPDGRWMIFTSANSGTLEGDENEALDVFLYDRYSRNLTPLSTRAGGTTGNDPSVGGRLSADGRFFAFTTFAGDLFPGDDSRYSDVVWGTVEPVPPLDADADGLPDVWERDCFGSLAESAAGDPDRDGQNNREEYLTRTIPADAASRLSVAGVQVLPGGLEVSWEGRAGVSYQLERSEALGAGTAWSPTGDAVAGYEGRMHQVVPEADATAFFRVVVAP